MARVIEGTWEEIKSHEAELTGRRVRLVVKSERPTSAMTARAGISAGSRRVSALGKYAGLLSSAEFMRSKQEEIDLEDRVRP